MVKYNSVQDTHLQMIYILLKTKCSISIGYRKKQDSGELRNLSEVIQLEIKYRCAQPQSSPLFYDSTMECSTKRSDASDVKNEERLPRLTREGLR